ncbi:MAG: GNAT family N-acetyltransferase [Pseudomonadota bacterium]
MTDPSYSIVAQTPAIDVYLRLREITGLSPFAAEAAQIGLQGALHSICVVCNGETVGMGRVIGDGGCFVQIVDIAVDPDHQGKGLGKAIMSALMTYVDEQLPASTYVSLLADVPADQLYAQYGFQNTAPRTIGMSYRVK